MTFRKATSLKDKLIQTEFVGQFKKDPCKRLGTFSCGWCAICCYMNTDPHFVLPNGRVFKLQHFANCKTSGVIYLFQCQCLSFYVGKTKLEFWKRAGRHIKSITKANPELPLGRHVRDFQAGKIPTFSFLILDRVHPNTRGGDWNNVLLPRECSWIMDLCATLPCKLYTVLSFRPFLEGLSSVVCEKDMWFI